ncbi:MAG: YhcH/YjgK/YiaL family protein [Ginsengibacter sp.]
MIIDDLSNAEKYFCVHPLFAKAFEYIHAQNLVTIEVGKYEIERDSLKAIVSNKKGMTAEESAAKFECHNKHIDIQVCINGREQIGWKTRGNCTQQKGDYNAEKDVVFYSDAPDMYFHLTNNQFAIFFPEDVHAPMIGEEDIKKMVVKVKI